jgi:N-formylglutamate amidohydrolase
MTAKNLSKLFRHFCLMGLCWLLIYACEKTVDNQKADWNDYIIFREGNIPLLLVAPHGGDLKPQWIENRDCDGAVITQDQYTLGIALQIENELKKRAYQPYVVFAKIHRVKVDLNRSLETSHCEDDGSNDLWREFHQQIESYRNKIIQKYSRGLLIDIHGHGHPNQRIELGYLLSSDQLRSLSTNGSLGNSLTSINSLVNNHPENISLNELIIGENSLGSLLSSAGFPSVPSTQDPAPNLGDPFFSGGSNTKLYGSRNRSGVDAIQLELNRQNLRQESEDRIRFSKNFAAVILSYLQHHYSDAFPASD